jgi:C4-dicarboxylate-specific signal transduction histidine kinase
VAIQEAKVDGRAVQMKNNVIFVRMFPSAAKRLLEQSGSAVKLSGRALDILIALVEHAGEIMDERYRLDWSYHRLSERERIVLRRLAIFAGIFTLAGARQVASWDDVDENEIVAAVASLVSKSLVAVDGSDTTARLRLPDTTRAYALEKLAGCGEADQMAQRHAVYNLRVFERANPIATAPLEEGSHTAAMQLGDIRSASERACSERGDNAVGAGLAAAGGALARGLQGAEELADLHNQLKQAEAALREAELRYLDAQMQLAHVNRIATLGQLAASIAHEINQPIAATLLNAGTALRWLAASPPKLESARQSIDRIITDGKRAADIIGRIRGFVRKAPARKKGLEINEVIFEVIGLTCNEMSKNRVLVQTRLANGLPSIWGDRVQLQQVILNLIMNAIEAMSEVGEGSRELVISTSRTDSDGVLVAVSDSGPGLPHASPECIFEAFYTTKPSGLGMGLSICRSIVEMHGGRLWAAPNQPHGAVFRLMLPIEEKSLGPAS